MDATVDEMGNRLGDRVVVKTSSLLDLRSTDRPTPRYSICFGSLSLSRSFIPRNFLSLTLSDLLYSFANVVAVVISFSIFLAYIVFTV
jgi:hypothetical protein